MMTSKTLGYAQDTHAAEFIRFVHLDKTGHDAVISFMSPTLLETITGQVFVPKFIVECPCCN